VLRMLIRPRTPARLGRAAGLAAAVTGGCVALAACGPVQLGSAAIVGGHRITTSTLTTEVSDLTNYYNAHHSKVQLTFSTSQTPQEVLAWLIRFAVRNELATREGITVSAGDVQRAVQEIAAQAQQSGGSTSLTDLAVANGLPPNLISSELGRYQAIADLLVARLDGGVNPTSQTAQQALDNEFNHAQCVAAKSLDIKINPQFGRLDYSQLAIVASPNTLSAPGPGASPTPSASPSTKPQLSPPC
jgi:SurA-like protein